MGRDRSRLDPTVLNTDAVEANRPVRVPIATAARTPPMGTAGTGGPLAAATGGTRATPPLMAAAGTGELGDANEVVECTSRAQLVSLLEQRGEDAPEMRMFLNDAIGMLAEERGVPRSSILEMVAAEWFRRAFGFPILELECREEETSPGLVHFRVRVEAPHSEERARLRPGEELGHRYRDKLMAALPRRQPRDARLDRLVQVDWAKRGSIEAGGIVPLPLLVLVLVTVVQRSTAQLSKRASATSWSDGCPCCSRSGREWEAAGMLRDLASLGAEFFVQRTGSILVRLPAARELASSWGMCAVL